MNQSKENSRFITTLATVALDAIAVRLIPTGGAYGLNDCLTNDKGPMVEFYLLRDEVDNHRAPYFIARYYADTIDTLNPHEGLSLQGGNPKYDLSAENCRAVVAALLAEREPAAAEAGALTDKAKDALRLLAWENYVIVDDEMVVDDHGEIEEIKGEGYWVPIRVWIDVELAKDVI